MLRFERGGHGDLPSLQGGTANRISPEAGGGGVENAVRTLRVPLHGNGRHQARLAFYPDAAGATASGVNSISVGPPAPNAPAISF